MINTNASLFNKLKFLRRKFVFYPLLFFVLYTSSYSVLSFFGSYQSAISGNYRYTFGLSLPDIEVWCPKMCYAHLFRTVNGHRTIRSNFMGLIYCPLILIDQLYIHKTIEVQEFLKQEQQSP